MINIDKFNKVFDDWLCRCVKKYKAELNTPQTMEERYDQAVIESGQITIFDMGD